MNCKRMKHRIKMLPLYLLVILCYRRKFSHIGARSIIYKPVQLDGTHSISIGDRSAVGKYSWLMGNEDTDEETLVIKNGVSIGHFAHIIALRKVVIEDSALIADRVFISDCTHEYKDVEVPVIKQEIKTISEVIIGEGSWIGENVCIMGAKVGKHCVVGANSVVTSDLPDYTVAVGNPAKVIKRFDFTNGVWIGVPVLETDN